MRWIDRIAYEVITAWTRWKIYRASPQLKKLEKDIAEARRAHRPVRHLTKQVQAIKLQMLRGA